MATTPFANLTPQKTLWVSTTGSDRNSGSKDSPMRTIQAAVDKATPGTAVMVKSGIYIENVQFTKNGQDNAPIWLISADGPEKAVVKAANNGMSVIYAHGEDNIAVMNFKVEGGTNGIQFSMSGSNFNDPTRNILIQGNTVVGTSQDGIKISQGTNVHILDNKISRAGDQGIDFVAVNNSVIARNDVSNVTGSSGAIFAKGGSTNVRIEQNYVHDIKVDGIVVGGWTDSKWAWPGSHSYEAREVVVTGNKVENVGKRPLNFLGAHDSEAYGNYLGANPDYYVAVNVGPGGPNSIPRPVSKNLSIHDNLITDAKKMLGVEAGNNNAIEFVNNKASGAWTGKTGPDATPIPEEPASEGTLPPDEGATPPSPGGWSESAKWTHVVAGGETGSQTLHGTAGNDYIDGKAGIDTGIGGQGDDTYVIGGPLDSIIEKADEGIDTALLWTPSYTLPDHVENMQLKRDDPTSSLTGNTLANMIKGAGGADLINGRGGNDLLIGGAGKDTFTIAKDEGSDTIADFAPSDDKIDLRGLTIRSFADLLAVTQVKENNTLIKLNDQQTLTLQGVASGALTTENFLIDGKAMPAGETPPPAGQTITGTDGIDTLIGTEGADQINGGLGNDMLVGRGGADLFIVEAEHGNDKIADLDSTDIIELRGFAVGDIATLRPYMTQTGQDVRIDLPEGQSLTLLMRSLDDLRPENFSFVPRNEPGGPWDRVLLGTQGNDRLESSDSHDLLIGGAGNDVLNGKAGADRMVGGAGNDIFYVDDTADIVVDQHNGGYEIVYASIDFRLGLFLNDLTLQGDAVRGTGNVWANRIMGNTRDNHLVGGAGDDRILGEAGNNVLDGGAGADILSGGQGRDTFSFRKGEADGDTITDFDAGDVLIFQGYGGGTELRKTGSGWQIRDGEHVETLQIEGVHWIGADLHNLS